MEKKYYDDNQCVYCGRYENENASDEWGWFELDDEGDKVCPRCFSRLKRLED